MIIWIWGVRKGRCAEGYAHGFIVAPTLYHHLHTSFFLTHKEPGKASWMRYRGVLEAAEHGSNGYAKIQVYLPGPTAPSF